MAGNERNELVRSYLDGAIGRRLFVRRLLAAGVTAAAAVSYADVLAPRTARAKSLRDRGPGIGTLLPNGFYNFYVGVLDNQFGPSNVQVYRRGDSVSWGMVGDHDHSVTESSGLDFFDSGYSPPTRTMFTMIFPAAGSFPYHCKDPNHASSMNGTVKVLVGRVPYFGPVNSNFTIKWAQKAADPGYVFDVQVRPPNDTFHRFKKGVTNAQTTFTPHQAGTFAFRGRVRHKATGHTSGWSPPSFITVHT